jgi:hypothetical protein
VVTIPEFAFREGKARLASLPPAADHRERWEADSARMRHELRDQLLGGFPRPVAPEPRVTRQPTAGSFAIEMTPESGLRLSCLIRSVSGAKADASRSRGTVLLLGTLATDPGQPASPDSAAAWAEAGYTAASLGLRATGPWKPQTPSVAGVADHNEAEWGLWVGRPLLGQWVWDVLRWVEVLRTFESDSRGPGRAPELPRPFTVLGRGPMALAAILAAALEPRIDAVAVDEVLVSYVGRTAAPWAKIPMGIIVPDLLDVGDTGHLAALVAPRPLSVGGGIETDGQPAEPSRLASAFGYTKSIYGLLGASGALKLGVSVGPPSPT